MASLELLHSSLRPKRVCRASRRVVGDEANGKATRGGASCAATEGVERAGRLTVRCRRASKRALEAWREAELDFDKERETFDFRVKLQMVREYIVRSDISTDPL
jgi:hypothetical protein